MVDTVTINIQQGGLRGKKVTTKHGVTYFSFQGIPYAKPPVGPLRFKAPEPAEPWEGVRDALIEGSIAPQNDQVLGNGFADNEDCLFLNVYTPKLPQGKADASKSVMFWVHGGGYYVGSSNTVFYGPDYLMGADVVLVTINYRLGPLGFLSTGDSEIPGNMGFKDQVMALRWVQLNIAHFGGDSGNVTIFGQSAGAGSVHHLLLSPMTKGLFHRAIAQSGSAVSPWSFCDPALARKKAFRVGETLGCKTHSSQELAKFLRQVTVKDLLQGVENTVREEEKHPQPLFFCPTKEETSEEEAFLSDVPINIISQGKFNQVPFMMGYTAVEAIFVLKDVLAHPEWFESLNENLYPLISNLLHVEDAEKAKEIGQKVKLFYFGDKRIGENTHQNYVNFFSDLWFISGIHTSMKNHVAASNQPFYLYQFSYDGKMSFTDIFMGPNRLPGASHGDDLSYLFHMFHHDNLDLNPEEECMRVMSKMIKLWTNFAKTGNPTPEEDVPLLGVKWEPVTKTEFRYLNIREKLSMESEFDEKSVDFWEEIFEST